MGSIIALMGQLAAKIFTDKVLGYLAMKAILVFLFTIVVPIILNNFLFDIIQIVMNFANGQAGGAGTLDGTMSFTGFGAFLIESFKLAQCLAVLVSAYVLRVALTMIPFVGVK